MSVAVISWRKMMSGVEGGVEEWRVERWLRAADMRMSLKGAMKSMFQDMRRILFVVGSDGGFVGVEVDEDGIQ